MDEKVYIGKIKKIRNLISELVDDLWKDKENQEVFVTKDKLKEQILDDIVSGYENE